MTRRNLFLLALLLQVTMCAAMLSAQTVTISHPEKMSISTQMFLDEMAGNISFNATAEPQDFAALLPEPVRPFAEPEVIGGKAYISSFVWVDSEAVIGQLKEVGVIVEEVFDKGLLTALVPVDKIHKVTAIDGVSRIEVSSVMRLATDEARKRTHVGDVLGFTAAAAELNLPKAYDGSGVIVGVIDRGIDMDHIAFQDTAGNTRIKRAYVYNGSQIINYYGTGPLPNDNVTNTDHGTHTSSIAGGSSVVVDGDSVKVTTNHAKATYGGMAPGAELFLCGINGMAATRIANAFKRICSYADSVGKPVVVSNSYGDYVYNRDGSGAQGEVVSQLFGEGHPNRICVFATSNNAGHSGGRPGGVYVSGPASAEQPLGTVICSTDLAHSYGWQYYRGEFIADAFTRATDASGIGVRLYVLDAEDGAVVDSIVCESTGGNKVLTLSDYFTASGGASNAKVSVYFDYMTGKGRKQALLYTQYGLMSDEHTLAVEVYPIGGSEDVIDMWSCGTYTYFDAHLTTEGHNWTVGSDDMSVMANACYPEVISVGSYVSRTCEGSNDVGDISKFSCYALEGMGPMGTMHPWITAPGQDIISAFNHRVNRSSNEDVVVNHPTYLYGLMSGTSMATPMVAGIVALWMQAAKECGKRLTLDEVKTIMKETAIRDEWVTIGANASHFGNGKIDALAGIAYILNNYSGHEPGDVNHDEAVNIFDVTTLIDYLLNDQTEICHDCADVNGDGVINIADVTSLIDVLLSGK